MGEINELDGVLRKYIGGNKNIVDIKRENLVAPGENYGGELLKIEITTQDETDGSKEKLHAVAKKIPLLEYMQTLLNVQQTFRGEIIFYEKIVPILQNFQRISGVHNVMNCFPEFYGARISTDEASDMVDRTGLILLENLQQSGFANIDRQVGYDFESAELLLRDLAALHAVPLAMKLKDPKLFEDQIRRHCENTINLNEQQIFDFHHALSLSIQDILWESDKCSHLIPKVKNNLEAPENFKSKVREPFATLVHEDLWVNNAMIKIINGIPIENKFVDFQLYTYKSPASDLLFFLFTSVKLDVLQKNLDTLINHYHSEFIRNLNQLGCDTSLFGLSEFRKELAMESKIELGHSLMFISRVIFGESSKTSEKPSIPQQEVDRASTTFRDEMRKNTHPKAKEKIWFTVREFDKNGWL